MAVDPAPLAPTAKVNVALVQLRNASYDVAANCAHMRDMVLQAGHTGEAQGAPLHLVVLPEIWNSQNGHEYYSQYAEPIPAVGESASSWDAKAYTSRQMSQVAAEAGVWLVGGSIPERDGTLLYNCATVWSPAGELVQKYRKTHLFDLCLPKMTFRESDTITPGQALATFDTPFGRFGLAICYDIRFAEVAMLAARKGCLAMIYPAAFNCHTGPLHWELLQRCRALDNQIFVATCSPARDTSAAYVVYGHSMAVSPMGQVLASAETDETIVYTTFDPQLMVDTRAGIPLLSQRRFDLYADIAQVDVKPL